MVFQFPKILSIQLTHNSTIALMNSYPREIKSYVYIKAIECQMKFNE